MVGQPELNFEVKYFGLTGSPCHNDPAVFTAWPQKHARAVKTVSLYLLHHYSC